MKRVVCIAFATAIVLATSAARAEAQLKLAIGARGNWETAASELGQNAGFFKKRGLQLEILYTQGSGETQQAVISGSVEIGIGLGTTSVMAAFAKGRAGARDRQRQHRFERILVCAGQFARAEHAGSGRQDHCVFDQRIIEPS
jgi:ABC-type nitrate/sulfonate/bicarbonate transport system substrate-binding protein